MTESARTLHERRARLFERLEAEPWAHDFYAVLREIESLSPGTPRLGRALCRVPNRCAWGKTRNSISHRPR